MGIKKSDKYAHKYLLGKVAKTLYFAVILLSIIFLLYIAVFQNVDVYQARNDDQYGAVQYTSKKEVLDKNTPIGVYNEYSWTQENVSKGQNCLAFYVVHQYAEVYFDGQLMYSLKPNADNKIGKTTASNWVIVPIYEEDKGKKISVKIIPAYKAVRDRKVNFFIGSKYMLYYNQLRMDFPQIVLSLLSMLVGVVFAVISMFHKYKGKENVNLNYLGIFSFAIGLWKITDVRSAPLMFKKNPEVLSYTSLIMLLIGIFTWVLSIKKQFTKKSYEVLDLGAVGCCIVALIIMFLQVTNIADLRETLLVTHAVIAIMVLLLTGTCIYERKQIMKDRKGKILFICFLLCIAGIIIDMMTYYVVGSSSRILYTLTSFIIYVVTMGCISISEINHKANIDLQTGLFNKSRCNEILDANEVIQEPIGIIMFDLNRLKQTNDTYGHEAGDILITEFSNVLRDNIASTNFVGRYGGDEFIAVVKCSDNKRIQQLLNSILKSTFDYNQKNTKINISYSSGYALSKDNPDLSLRELLKKADDMMYHNKKSGREIIES